MESYSDKTYLVTEDLDQIFDKDHYTEEWLMVKNPYPLFCVLFVYLLFILKIGPNFMCTRPPYRCLTLLRLYNAFQVAYNLWFLYGVAMFPNIVQTLMKNNCVLEKDNNLEMEKKALLYYYWHYLILKMLDLLDTVFMVLRKKNSHITFLHVYHHVSMTLIIWFFLKYAKSQHAVIPGAINIFVHAIMYSYYLLATFPHMKKYLWWKKYLTKLQISQFVLILLYFSYIYYNGCPMSKIFTYGLGFIVFSFLCLFANFYFKTYFTKSSLEGKNPSSKLL